MSIATQPSPSARAKAAVAPEVAVRALEQQLRASQTRELRLRTATGAIAALATVLLAIGGMAALDYYLELATAWRAVWLVALIAAASVAAVFAWRRWIAPYTLSRAAVSAESRVAKFGQRLRTTLDYEHREPQPAPASPSLLSALRTETHSVAQEANWDQVVDRRPLIGCALAGVAVAMVWAVALFASPEFRVSAGRAFWLPWQYTTVTYTPETSTVRYGEAVTIEAEVAGRPIESAQLRYRPAGSKDEWTVVGLRSGDDSKPETKPIEAKHGDVTTASVERESEYDEEPPLLHGQLVAKLSDLRSDLEFEVLAGPRSLPPGSIHVVQPLKLEAASAHIVSPAYTGKPDETVDKLDLKVLEGSNVELRLELSREASEVQISFPPPPAKNDPEAPPAIIPVVQDGNLVLVTLDDLRKSGSYVISAKTTDGMTLDPVRVDVRVQLDRPPTVEFVQPPEELVVTATTEVPMIVEAGDDLGLHRVGIEYQINSDPPKTLWSHDAEGSTDPLRAPSMLMLEEHALSFRDAVTYYAWAEDNYFGQPRRVTTPLRFIDIRPYKLTYKLVEGEGSCNGSSVTLEELISRQRGSLSRGFALQDRASLDPATAEKLVTEQSEVLAKTEEFAAGLAQLGAEIPELDGAAHQMHLAVTLLEQSLVTEAVFAEQEALAELIHARQNLRKKLCQSNSQSASACRKFDREQRQKMRMPQRKKTEDKKQQVADARKKLEDLAKREREWSEQAKQACNNPSSSQSSSSKPGSKSESQPSSQTSQSASSESPSPPQAEAGEKPTPSREEVAAAQAKMREELAALQSQLEKLEAKSDAARQQAQQASESMAQAQQEVQKQNGDAAAKEGERSAEQLEQLSAHLAAMNARDFGQRLDQAQKLAQQLAGQQGALNKQLGGSKPGEQSSPSPSQEGAKEGQSGEGQPSNEESNASSGSRSGEELARDQKALAAQTEMLADLLDALRNAAASEDGQVGQKLEQIQAENPPRDIASLMRQAGDDLQAERQAQAGSGVAQAADRLAELSRSLGAANGEFAQPRLKELMALEEQLAQLMKQLQRELLKGDKGDKSAAEQQWRELEERLDALAAADPRLADALRRLGEGASAKANPNPVAQASQNENAGAAQPRPGSQVRPANYEAGGSETPEGFYSWGELPDYNGLREVSKTLQTKIQETILAAALMDADQPAPPEYKDLIERYYRALSDDLR